MTLLAQDAYRAAAKQATVDAWIAKYKLVHDVCADPAMSIAAGGSIGLPYNVIVDPRTMKIVKIVEGYGGMIEPALDVLAKKNKSM